MKIVKADTGTAVAANQKLDQIETAWRACAMGKKLPDFEVLTITGEQLTSRLLFGKVVVINFWFTHCAPCIAEMPGLNQLVNEYDRKGVVFIGFTFESKRTVVEDFFPHHPFGFKVVTEASAMEKLFGVTDYPTTFVVDGQGKVIEAWSGGNAGSEAAGDVYRKAKPAIDAILGSN